MQAIVLKATGSEKNFAITEIEDPKFRKNEVLIKQTTIGINFFDILFRNGTYGLEKLPAILGLEACGVIEKVGSEVKDFEVGERVAYATGGIGAYASKRAIHQDYLIKVPKNITDDIAAAILYKGLMAHALLHRVYIASRAKRIFVSGAAGGVGHILCQLAKSLKLEVIGGVGSEEKINFAKSFGCDHAFNYNTKDIIEEIGNITNHHGVGIVYDGVGKDTLEKSINCLWPMGMCVSYGESSGPTNKLDLNMLVANSLYLTRPTMAMYKANRVELTLSASEVFSAVEQGIIKPKITAYNFKDIAKAHQDLESRKTVGSLILKL